MIRSILFSAFLVFVLSSSSHGKEGQVSASAQKNIYNMIEEMLGYHVEYKEFTPFLAKRSLKLFIEQFDLYKIYLLQSEVSEFLSPSEKLLEKIVQEHFEGKYTTYEKINRTIQASIQRARKIRAKVVSSLSTENNALSKEKIEKGSFSRTPLELEQKIKKQLISILFSEQELEGVDVLSQEERKKVLDLWEGRFRRSEDSYLSDQSDSFFSMHVLKACAKSLDAHTSFFSTEEAYDLKTSLEKQFEGIGIVLREGIRGVVIKSLIKNGPAEKSGKIQIGDLLLEVNGRFVKDSSYEEILKLLKGEKGQKVSLRFSRLQDGESKDFKVELTREKIVMEEERVRHASIPFGEGVIGMIDLPSFYESKDGSSCEKDLKEAIRQLRSQENLVGLVIDMRENSGGFLGQAVKVASLFMSSGVVVVSKYSEGHMQYLREMNGKIFYQEPLVLLTSKASASAAEIVAQALQDYGIAVIVGDERTYGKGTIQYQTITESKASSFFKVTVGKYYTVSGRSTQIEGVQADICVPTSYAPFNIGEKYLLYALKNDQIEPAFTDPLFDVSPRNKAWMQKNYLPNLQKKLSNWTEMMPILKANSAARLKYNKDFLCFLKLIKTDSQDEDISIPEKENFGEADLQMMEAVRIVQDMCLLEKRTKNQVVLQK